LKKSGQIGNYWTVWTEMKKAGHALYNIRAWHLSQSSTEDGELDILG